MRGRQYVPLGSHDRIELDSPGVQVECVCEESHQFGVERNIMSVAAKGPSSPRQHTYFLGYLLVKGN